MSTKKGKLLFQWLSSVLVILLVIGAITLPLRKNDLFGNGGSSSDEPSEDSTLEDGLHLDKEYLIF